MFNTYQMIDPDSCQRIHGPVINPSKLVYLVAGETKSVIGRRLFDSQNLLSLLKKLNQKLDFFLLKYKREDK